MDEQRARLLVRLLVRKYAFRRFLSDEEWGELRAAEDVLRSVLTDLETELKT